jgi:hypothetical protein
MKRGFCLSILLLAISLLGATVVGCREASGPRPSSRGSVNKSGPEESFKLIVETFRRGVEDVPIGFVVRQESGQSMMTGKNEVSHELIRPTKEGEPYRATITVTSQSRYSIQRTNEEVPAEEQTENPSALDTTGDSDDDDGQEIFDANLVGGGSAKTDTRRSSPGAPEQFIARRPDEGQQKYDLVYENGDWRLVTKLDPETEQSIRTAFEHAGVLVAVEK